MRNKWGLWVLAFVLWAVAYPSQRAMAQAVYGSIVGTVTDPTGAAVPGAKVTITNLGTGVRFETTTNESGNYQETHLTIGVYQVKVAKEGFQAYVQGNVSVAVDAVTPADVTLRVGPVTQSVTVEAEVTMLKTTRSDVAQTFTPKTVAELPILGRDINRFQFITPGVQIVGFTAASEQPQDIYRPRVNGQYWGGVAFQFDGTDNRESVLAEPVIAPNIDAVGELKITTAAYDAEFGQANQAVIAYTTKSGTNELHGSGFWYRRDSNTSARDPFAQARPIPGTNNRFIPPILWNQYGGSLGGPIQKNKTFIFGDYQGTGQSIGASSVPLRVPTSAERAGDLSGLGVKIFDPCTPDLSNCNIAPAARTQFSNNAIPPPRVSQQAQNLLKFIPPPNIPGASGALPNYVGSGTAIQNSQAFDVRVDRYQTEKLHMFGRYSLQHYTLQAPGAFGFEAGGPSLQGFPFSGTSALLNHSVAYGFDYSLAPNWMTDFRFGFFRYRVFVNPNGLGTTPATDSGVKGLNVDQVTSGMPAFFLNGVGGFNFGYALGINQCNCPLNEQENEFQWVNNWTNTRGNHTIKFGADIRYQQNLRVPSDSHRSGQLTFDPPRTSGPGGVGGLGLASFLLGDVGTLNRYVSTSTNAAERQKRTFFYAQDAWRITPKLTLNYGLRWEIYFPQYVNGPRQGGLLNLATGEVWTMGQGGISLNGNVANTFTHFAPRFGVAYQATPKTVVRMGYGRSYDVGVFGTSFGHNVTQNLPVLGIQSLNPVNPWLSVFNLAQGPSSLDPSTILNSQPQGATGKPLYPNGVTPNILPLTPDHHMRLPTVDAWNVTAERQITPTIVASLGYVGNKGTYIAPGGTNYNINQPTVAGFGTLSTNQRRPFFQQYGWTQNLKYFSDDGTTKFSSLQARVEKRFSSGLLFQANYTWGRAFDFDNDYFFWNARIDYGPENNWRDHILTMHEVYELPFGRGKKFDGNASPALNYLIGGWQLGSVWIIESGLPFTPSYQDCGQDRDTGPCRAIKLGPAGVSNPSPSQWFLTTDGVELATRGLALGPWQRPLLGTFGTVGRNSFHGPKFFQADMSLLKNFQITEKLKGQFRAESFNAFNRVNPAQPDGCVDCRTGGKIFSLFSNAVMRQWQFALRLEF